MPVMFDSVYTGAVHLTQHTVYTGAVHLTQHSVYTGAVHLTQHSVYTGAVHLTQHSVYTGAVHLTQHSAAFTSSWTTFLSLALYWPVSTVTASYVQAVSIYVAVITALMCNVDKPQQAMHI